MYETQSTLRNKREAGNKEEKYISDMLPIIKRIINRCKLQWLVNVLYYCRNRCLRYIYNIYYDQRVYDFRSVESLITIICRCD